MERRSSTHMPPVAGADRGHVFRELSGTKGYLPKTSISVMSVNWQPP